MADREEEVVTGHESDEMVAKEVVEVAGAEWGTTPLPAAAVVTSESVPKRSGTRRSGTGWALVLVDWLAALGVMSPLCTLYWRGTWQLVDCYLLTSRPIPSAFVSALIGYSITCACNVAQRPLTRFLVSGRYRLAAALLSRLYIALFAFGLVNHWRGVWQLLDLHFGKSWMSGAASAGLGVGVLAAMRALRNVMAPPLSLVSDRLDKDFAYSPTLFRTVQIAETTFPLRSSGASFSMSLEVTVAIQFVDTFLGLFVLGPLTVGFWRGTWSLLDIYLDPLVAPLTGACLCAALGALVACVQLVAGRRLQAAVVDAKAPSWLVLSRGYLVLVSVAQVAHWRGLMLMLDLLLPDCGVGWVLVQVGGALLLLAAARGICNLSAPPLCIATDEAEEFFLGGLDRKCSDDKVNGCCRFVSDVAFSVAVVGSLVVFVWRGLWTVFDAVLVSHTPAHSGCRSLALGYGLVLFAYATQYQAAAISRRLTPPILKILFEDLFVLVASVGAINVWRGGWVLSDAYIFPGDYVLSNWVTSVVGLSGSILLFAGNTVLARGVFLDGELKDGSGCIFANQYLRKFLKQSGRVVASEMQSFVGESVVTSDDIKCNSVPIKLNGRVTVIGRDGSDSDTELTKPEVVRTDTEPSTKVILFDRESVV